MRKTKIIIIALALIALIGLSKKPLTNNDIEQIAPVSNEVKDSIDKSKDAFDFLKEKGNEYFNILKNNLGYSTAAKNDNYSADKYDVTNTEVEAFELIRVVDGDTIVINDAGIDVKVRLIGIDSPESVHSNKEKNTVYGTYASNYTKSILENINTIYLSYDKDPTDQYGRILAYAWLQEPNDINNYEEIEKKMLNYNILVNGYAVDKVYKPNDKYAEIFNTAKMYAQTEKIGLWQYDEFRELQSE